MNTSKHQIIVGCLVLVAFLWGYKRDSLELALAELISGLSSSPAESPAAAAVSPPTPGNAGANAALPRPVTPDPFGNAYRSLAGGQPPVNSGSAAPSPFAGNLDSIRAGQIKETQSVQRNAYFDKLSEQMKQLRGSQTIPEPPPAPRNAEPVVDTTATIPPSPSPTERLHQQQAGSPAIEIPGITGAHPEFSAGDDGEDDSSVDEELDTLDDELSDLEASADDEDEP